jgi:WD40 repeat protein
MRTLLFPAALLAVLPFTAHADDLKKAPADPAGPIEVIKLERKEPVLYDKDVEPILVNKCMFCHSGNLKEGKLDMASYESLVKGGKRGNPIVPGNADASLLYKLCGKTTPPLMPPKKEIPLSPKELALIKLWIDQGAKAPATIREKPKVIVSLPPANVKPVRGIAVSPDKSTVVASRGNEIHIYDAGSGQYVRSLVDPELKTPDKKQEVKAAHLSLVESLAYSPDGKYIASGSFQEVILWDAATGELRVRFTGYADRVVTLAFSNDSKMLATGGGAPTEDGEVKVYEVPSGKQIVDIKNSHSDVVYGVCFSPDDKMLATCGADKFVKTWELPAGKLLKTFEGHTAHVLDVGWAPDGKLLASAGADNVVKVWDFEKGEQARTINAHTKQVTRLVFVGKKNEFLTCSGDQAVRKFRTDGGNAGNYPGGTDYLYAVGVSPDGSVVAAGGQEGVVRVYDAAGKLLKTLAPPGAEPKKEK